MLSDELKSLYPDLSSEELLEAKENLDRYLLLAWEVFEESESKSKPIDGSISES